MAVAPAPGAAASPGEWRGIPRSVLTAAVVFALVGLLVQGWRLEALRASWPALTMGSWCFNGDPPTGR